MEFNQNNEPFIRPHSNLRLMPPRLSDGEAVLHILNDPKTYMNLIGPPFPYTQKDWNGWFPIISKVSKDALAEWREVEEWGRAEKEVRVSRHRSAAEEGGREWMGAGSTVMSIRELDQATLEESFLGEITIKRYRFLTVTNEEERRAEEENNALRGGDPGIVWEFGCRYSGFLLRKLIFHYYLSDDNHLTSPSQAC
jgi:hypothetical protein